MSRRLALIPARGGSKALPGKNLAVVGGITLVARAVRCALDAGIFSTVLVSSDDEAIAREGRAAGALVPFLRPAALAGDEAPVIDTIHHALEALEQTMPPFDLVALLEPTSPLRTAEIVRQVVYAAEAPGADAALSVSAVPHRYHPFKQFVLDDTGHVRHFVTAGERVVRRQELGATYVRNGMCYAVRRSSLDEGRGVLGSAARIVVVPGPIVNIDDAADLELARRLLEAESEPAAVEGQRT